MYDALPEIYPGHFTLRSDFLTPAEVLSQVLDLDYPYVYLINHKEVRSSWTTYNWKLFDVPVGNVKVKVRQVQQECLLKTSDFIQMIPKIQEAIRLVQIRNPPPDNINVHNLQGRSLYQFYQDVLDYHVAVEVPGAPDYGTVITPSVKLAEKLISLKAD